MEHTPVGSLAVWQHCVKGRPRGRVLLVHGICEHSGRHLNTVGALNRQGFDVVRFDLRGSGQSGGKRQHVDKWEDYVADVVEVYNWICRTLPELPLFVLGHSMGGAISAYFALAYQKHLSGLILSAPAFLVGGAISPLKIAAGRLLSNWLPTLKVPGGEDRGAISRDTAVVEAYWCDPYAFHFNTVRQGNEVLRGIGDMPRICAELNLPVFIVHGAADRIIRIEGSFQLIRCMRGKYKTMLIQPKGYHEPHNDLDKEDYFLSLGHWLEFIVTLDEHLDSPSRKTK